MKMAMCDSLFPVLLNWKCVSPEKSLRLPNMIPLLVVAGESTARVRCAAGNLPAFGCG
jgi:hypothetical protein